VSEPQEAEATFAYDLNWGGGSDSSTVALVYKLAKDEWCIRLRENRTDPKKVWTDVLVSQAKIIPQRPKDDQFSEDILDQKSAPSRKVRNTLSGAIRRDNPHAFKYGLYKIA